MNFARRYVLAVLGVLGVLFLVAAMVPQNECAGTGSPGGLQCSGDCPGQISCKKHYRDNVTPPHWWCGCSNLDRNQDEYRCCHLVQVYNAGDENVYSINGDCPSCPLTGLCTLGTSPATAGCVN